ncbi:MAG: KamA family radical SAM protein [Bacteroidales bacterium]
MAHSVLKKFKKNLPEIYKIATQSPTEEEFCLNLKLYANSILEEESNKKSDRYNAASSIITFLEYESTYIIELSKGEKIFIETISGLWNFLNENHTGNNDDFYEDLYQLLLRTNKVYRRYEYSLKMLRRDMSRWPAGFSKEIHEKRVKNKKRIIEQLVKKIDKKSSETSRYHFEDGLSYQEKINKVEEWWQDFRFHLIMAVKSPSELNHFLGDTLSVKTMGILGRAKNKRIPFFVTPYYLSILNTYEKGYDDFAVRNYVIYSESLVNTYGNIKAWEREDEVTPGEPNAAGWILPAGNNIHRRYPEVAIMIPDTRGRSCGGLCASCQRMYDFQSERLNFDMETLKPAESWGKKLIKLMEYFEYDPLIKDILITGGDALMSKNKVLEQILDEVLKMAIRKREANKKREINDKFEEIKRVRLGSRLPAYLPLRINDQLIEILANFKKKAAAAGIEQFIVQTHFQSPLEVTVEARKAIKDILSAGWIITNQLVFTTPVSRRGHTAKLRQVLNSLGVLTYYTFTVKGFEENREMFTPNSRSVQEQMEEKLFGKIDSEKQKNLIEIFKKEKDLALSLKKFLKENNLQFLPTDRNVLNLPAIGKSMTFELIGITNDGRRILKFDHDRTRKHSQVIDTMEEVYIAENRSISSYLRDLESMGEKIENYSSIWGYTKSTTEHLFPLFEYDS